jgi:hypothetical protein
MEGKHSRFVSLATAQDYASEQGVFTDLNKLARVIDSSIANVKGKA